MNNGQKTKIRWGEGWIPATALALVIVLCLLTAVNRVPRKIAVQPVHAVQRDLYDFVRVDINAAGREQLMSLPGIGESLAGRIIDARPYQSIDELLNVNGIGPHTLEQLRPLVKLS